MKIEFVEISKIKLNPNNPRIIKDDKFKNLVNSIKAFPKMLEIRPIVVNDDMIVLGGNMRLRACQEADLKEIPIIKAAELTPEEQKQFIIRDNIAHGEWDWSMLANDWDNEDLKEWGLDVPEFEEIPKDGLTDEDAAPEPPDAPKTKLGDIYKLGSHRLMCGDSSSIDAVDKLMNGDRADVVFTDPPYGYSYESNHQNKHTILMNDDKMIDFAPACYASMLENSSIFVCGSFQNIGKWIDYISEHFNYKNLIVWKKNNWSMGDLKGAFAGQHELIIFAHKGRVELLGKRDPDVWSFDRVPPEIHPTQKPVELIEYAMSKVKSGIVLDLFGGSGSVLIACEKTNRDCRMMELDPKYCDVIVKRWEDFTGQKAELLNV